MISGFDILCFGPTDWWGMNPSCATHVMDQLSAANRIIYVNPISSDVLGVAGRKGLARRVTRKARSFLKCARKIRPGFYVVSPIFLPVQGVPALDWLNNLAVRIQIVVLLKALRFQAPLVWAENLRCVDLLSALKPKLIVYHVSDRFEECPYTKNKKRLRLRGAELTRRADVVVCVSRELYGSKQGHHDHVYYLPHGVDFELFRRAAEQPQQTLGQLQGISRPIAGYFGTLTALNDVELLEYCAARLPNVSFVLAGRITGGDYEALSARPNVHLIGQVPYEQIPALCASFDVCLLNWRMNDWIRHCNPLKFFEYMASGKPIVSVPINEIAENYSDLVSVAGTREEFCDAITRELEHDSADRVRRRIETAREHSWTNHVERLSAIIEQAIANRKE